MKVIIFAGLFAAAAASTPFACPAADWGACCEAYDPGDKLCYRGEQVPLFSLLTVYLFLYPPPEPGSQERAVKRMRNLTYGISTGQFATPVSPPNATATNVYECTDPVDIFSECCSGPKPNPSASPYTNCTPSTIQLY